MEWVWQEINIPFVLYLSLKIIYIMCASQLSGLSLRIQCGYLFGRKSDLDMYEKQGVIELVIKNKTG